MSNFEVDRCVCDRVAKVVRGLRLPRPREATPSMSFSESEEANLWFLLGAICHQTSPASGKPLSGIVDGREWRGWDYLLHTFRVAAEADRRLLMPETWRTFTERKVTGLFGEYITAPRRRALLINDLGIGLDRMGWATIFRAAAYCSNRIANHEPNLLATLSTFRAYSDPVQKKSSFFLALMANAGLWKYADPDELPAPVDYHEVRGHLRIGTVQATDARYRHAIETGVAISAEADVELRWAVRTALRHISVEAGTSANCLHYFFWNLFRTYCVRDKPLCDGSAFDRLPSEYREALLRMGRTACPFDRCCKSAYASSATNEHVTETEFY